MTSWDGRAARAEAPLRAEGPTVRKADLAALGSGTRRPEDRLAAHPPQVRRGRRAVREGRAPGRQRGLRRTMLAEVPGRFLDWSKRFDRGRPGRRGPAAKAVADSIRGVLVCEKVAFDDVGFGSELLVGVRNTREFGPVMTVGGGGLDVEYMNERIREGRSAALVLASRSSTRPGSGRSSSPWPSSARWPGRSGAGSPVIAPAALAATLRRFVGLARASPPSRRTLALRHRGVRGQSVRHPATGGSSRWTACAGSPGATRPLRGRARSRRSAVSSGRRRSGSSGSPRR